MPDDVNALLNEFGPDVMKAVGPLPAIFTPVAGVPSTVTDPDVVTTQLFGTKLDLQDRAALIRALEHAFPVEKGADGKDVVTYRGGREPLALLDTQAAPLVGPRAMVQVAAQTVATHAAALSSIKPLDPRAPEAHAYTTLVPLIRDTIADVVRNLARPHPVGPRIDVLLSALAGYDPATWTHLDIHNAGGYLGQLRDRAGLVLKNAKTDKDEQMLTRFATVVALTGMLIQTWHAERSSWNSGDYFGISVHELRRYFAAIVTGLGELQQLVPRATWLTTTLNTDPPLVAMDVWQWMHEFASRQGWQTLEHGGRDGMRLVALTMRKFAKLLDDGFVAKVVPVKAAAPAPAPAAAPECADGDTSYAHVFKDLPDYCGGAVPQPFKSKKVQNVVRQLKCHVVRVLEVVQDVIDEPSYVLHAKYFSDAGAPTEVASANCVFHARICGSLPPDATVHLAGAGEELEPEEITRDDIGAKVRFKLAGAKPGARQLVVARRNGTLRKVLPEKIFVTA